MACHYHALEEVPGSGGNTYLATQAGLPLLSSTVEVEKTSAQKLHVAIQQSHALVMLRCIHNSFCNAFGITTFDGHAQAEEVENAEAMAEAGLESAGKASRPAAIATADASGLPLQFQQQGYVHTVILSDVMLDI